MYKYAVIFLICVNISLSDSSCCEEQTRTTSYLDVVTTMISKAVKSVPICNETKKCDETKKCNETKECDTDIKLDCADWYQKGYNKSGVYTIRPVNRVTNNKAVDVYCDMETDGGGWTVIQRRGNFGNPDDYFYKDWESYKNGFGRIEKDFWIGNDNIYAISNQKPHSIRFDLQDKENKRAYATYESFWIDDEYHNYVIHISGYNGTAGDSMEFHNFCPFTTKDKANSIWGKENCAITFGGAWWYAKCLRTNLNGLYTEEKSKGIRWNQWEPVQRLTYTEMKIRPMKLD